jgi:hypothetical protein
VGNANDVCGKVYMVRVSVKKLRYFTIVGDKGILPHLSEVTTKVTVGHLRDGPNKGKGNSFTSSLPKWVLFFGGKG